MEEDRARRIAQEAANVAVARARDDLHSVVCDALTETLTKFGFDVTKPLDMQKDFQHLRSSRLATEAVKAKVLISMIGIIVAGAAGAVWLGFKDMLHK